MSEQCQRCGSVGQDRRTLQMNCFYDMAELPIPFVKTLLFQAGEEADFTITKAAEKITLKDGTEFTLTSPHVRCDGELIPQTVYTIRVCKRCRGEWLAAQVAWFQAQPQDEDHDADDYQPGEGCGSGIFIRERGAIKEITREEWDRRNPGREPVVVRKDDE